jgi:hypothetical protein
MKQRLLPWLCAALFWAGAQSVAIAQSPLLDIYKPALPGGKLRTYYIAAEEIVWSYAPSGKDEAMGHHLHGDRALYIERSAGTIGGSAKKAVFAAYTDDSFATRAARPPEDAYLGILGPILRAEVGDVIRVIFKNKASRDYSMHPHGVFYSKADEGAGYTDGTSFTEKRDDAVKPGDTQIYVGRFPSARVPVRAIRARLRGLTIVTSTSPPTPTPVSSARSSSPRAARRTPRAGRAASIASS